MNKKFLWIALFYLAEGFPYGFINDALPVYFRFQGISLQEIGLLSLIGLPWTLKFLWSPLVDVFGRRKIWIISCEALLAVTLMAVCYLSRSGSVSTVLWILLFGMAVFSATQDIAIDAYAIEILEPSEIGPANGVRVTLYRIALILAGGVLIAVAGFIGWTGAMAAAACFMVFLALAISLAPEPLSIKGRARAQSLAQAIATPLKQFYAKGGFWAVMLFILLFKIGDYALAPMAKAFWVDRHFTPFQIGLVPGTVGVAGTILGALLGGKLISRWGIFHALWILGGLQAISNLVYVLAAATEPSSAMMYAAVIVEAVCGGLGTASFLSFLMSICDKEHAATQYALLSALFGLGRSLAGAFSGYGAQHVGYPVYFAGTFFVALPAFVLLPWVRRWAPANTSNAV
ncbi:MAG: MFS transporter [Elusimicrobiota bacterium]